MCAAPPAEGCTVYGDFLSNESSGLLMDFSTDGDPIADRVVIGDEEADFAQDGVTIHFVSGYESAGGGLVFVTVEVDNQEATNLSFNGYSAVYITEDGHQVEPGDFYGPLEIFPGARAMTAFLIEGEELGGRLIVTGSYKDFNSRFEANIPVPLAG